MTGIVAAGTGLKEIERVEAASVDAGTAGHAAL
jgi:hypothetical protein